MDDLKLTIDLLPRGAWGHDLSKTLPKKDWNKLRNFCYAKANHKCEICGYGDADLHAHEVWDFDINTQTQTLKDIVALCPACHGVKHMRNSQRIGYGDHAKAHFMRINKCDAMKFAKHYTEAQFLFEEQNKIYRWQIKANLDKFGGKGIEIEKHYVPFIENPYEKVDWSTVKHWRETDKNQIILKDADNKPLNAVYFISRKPNMLPPKIDSIDVDNYAGTITVSGDRINKIDWMSNGRVIKTKFNFSGKFIATFSVEDLNEPHVRFVLSCNGGATASMEFGLIEI